MLHLYQASAGAGKTHALTHAYLQCALQAAGKMPHLLAITFTNKATEEMRQRFLEGAHKLATQQPTPLFHPLAQTFGGNTTLLKERAQTLLDSMLHHHDYWQVKTIDALFVQQATLLASELNISPNQTIALQVRCIVDDVLQELLHTLPHHPTLQAALITHTHAKIAAGKSWRLEPTLKAIAYEDLYNPLPTDLPSHQALTQLLDRHTDTIAQEAQELITVIAICTRQLAAAGWYAEDFAWGTRGIFGFLTKLALGQWPQVTPRIAQAVADPTCWAPKQGSHHAAITAHVTTQLQPLLATLLPRYERIYRDHATREAWTPLRHLLAARLQWRHLMKHHCHHAQVFLLATLPAHLKAIYHEQGVAWIKTRLGQDYHHLLIDEFQDLSTQQWQSLYPFITHALANHHTSFVVGDAKQAIYRWRGGNAELLLQGVTQQLGAGMTQNHHLPYNWRSTPHIVAFNNAFFGSTAVSLTQQLQEEVATHVQDRKHAQALAKRMEELQATYAHATQRLPPQARYPHEGHLELAFLPTSNAEGDPCNWMETAIQRTLAQITTLQEAGHPAHHIALLVRNHREATLLLDALHKASRQADETKQHYYQAVAGNTLKLGQSPHLQLIIHTLQALQHPHSVVHWQHVLHGYLHHGAGSKLPTPPSSYTLHTLQELHAHLPKILMPEASATLLRMPLYSLYHTLLSVLGIIDPDAFPYIQALQQAIHELSSQADADIATLLTWWQQEGIHQPLPTSAPTSIQVMTFHQAKGLAFPFVILPFAAWSLDHPAHTAPILWCSHEETPWQDLPPLPVYYGKQLLHTHYRAHYYHEKLKTYLEQFNLLYVALTRAIQGLYIFAPTTKEGSTATTVAHLLNQWRRHHLLTPSSAFHKKECWQDDKHTLILGSLPLATTQQASTTTSPHLPTLFPSTKKHSFLQELTSTIGWHGDWWHNFLTMLAHADQATALIRHYQAMGQLTPADGASLLQTLEQWWQNPQMASWFSGKWQVKRETTILLPNGTLLRPDRVMIDGQEAVVLDFKTGIPTPQHHRQVARYAQCMRQMGYEPVTGYLFYIPTQKLVALHSSKESRENCIL